MTIIYITFVGIKYYIYLYKVLINLFINMKLFIINKHVLDYDLNPAECKKAHQNAFNQLSLSLSKGITPKQIQSFYTAKNYVIFEYSEDNNGIYEYNFVGTGYNG